MNEVEKWDKYTRNDIMRNQIVIPYLIKKFESNKRWKSIIDLGSGSGYVTDKIFRSVLTKRNLILLDINSKFHDYAKKAYFGSSLHNITFLTNDYFNFDININPVDCIYSVFSTLEFEVNKQFASISSAYLKVKGSIILIVADSYFDILSYDHERNKADDFIKYGKVELTKKEISSKLNRPYIATRITKIIELMLFEDFSLITFDQFQHPDKERSKIFILNFKKHQK